MQHFIYRIKRSLRSKEGIFWALVFPIFLGLIFKFMFGNLGQVEQFSEVPVGIVEQEENDTFVKMMKEIEMESGVCMFDVTKYDSAEKAKTALQEKDIYAYILVDGDEFSLMIRDMDIQTSFVKSFVDQYRQNYTLIEDVAKKNPQNVQPLVESLFGESKISISQIDLKGQDKSPYTQYFYALLAMTCLIASTFGLETIHGLQADSSPLGARRNVAPTAKMKQFLIEMMADFLVYCVITLLVLVFLVYVCGQDFGNNFGLVLLATYAGSLCGLAAGFFIGTWVKGTKAKKDGLCVAFFMASSFFGGLQMAEMPYLLEQKFPIVNRINPATLIVHAYKSVAVFGDMKQYMINVVTLLVIAIVLAAASIAKMRRTRYASV